MFGKDRISVINYLSSEYFKGVSKNVAERLVDQFGLTVVEDIIEKDPKRLLEVKGVGKKVAKKIVEAHTIRSAFRALDELSLTKAEKKKIYAAFKENAASVVRYSPYQLIKLDGFGFKRVDQIAMRNGIAKDDPARIAAAIIYILQNIGMEGHCWTSADAMQAKLGEIIPEISTEQVIEVLGKQISEGEVVYDDSRLYAKSLYECEDGCARMIAKMMKEPPLRVISPMQVEMAISQMENETGFTLEEKQKDAVLCALRNRFSLITGGPGTGKSTIIRAILNAWKMVAPNFSRSVFLCAPTGKAARRMKEVTGVEASTIHRIINQYKRVVSSVDDSAVSLWEENDESEGIEYFQNRLIIVDEASMPDIRLAYSLMRLASNGNQLVLVGDVDQLPPIGPGSFFRDCLRCRQIPSVRLTLSHRQHGAIAVNAARINEGEPFHSLRLNDPSFEFIEADKESVRDAVIQKYIEYANQYGISDVCCVVPMRKHKRSHTAADDLNVFIRDIVNPVKNEVPIDVEDITDNGIAVKMTVYENPAKPTVIEAADQANTVYGTLKTDAAIEPGFTGKERAAQFSSWTYTGDLNAAKNLRVIALKAVQDPSRLRESMLKKNKDGDYVIDDTTGRPVFLVDNALPGIDLYAGDRIMNTVNNYDLEIFNGDTGYVHDIDKEEDTMDLLMDDGRVVTVDSEQAKDLILAYAITVHKAQGSEYKAIVVSQNMEHYTMLQRNLLYTAVTRAKERVALCGEKKAIGFAIATNPALRRNTRLLERILKYLAQL